MTIEEIGVKINWINAGFKAKTDETKKIFKSVASSVDDVKGHVSDLKNAFAKGWRNDEALKMTKAYRSVQDQIKKTADKLEYLYAKQSRMGDGLEMTGAAKKIQKEYDALAKSVSKWKEKQGSLNSTSFEYKDLADKIEKAQRNMLRLRAEAAKLKVSGGAYRYKESFLSLGHQIKNTEGTLSAYKAKADELANDGKAYEQPKKFSERLKEMGERLKGTTNKIKTFASHFPKIGQRAQAAGSSIKNFIKSAIGIGSIVMLFRRLRSAVSEGFGNLSQFSSRTSSDLAMLKGSLTQVKNSLAAAFAPILSVIAPLIQTFVNYITAACNALAQFFGALTGQKTVTIAKSGLGDLAAGATDAADATNSANSAAQEYQRTLMGFDQINKLDDKSSSGGSGGGGSAGGVGGAAGFETSQIANVYAGWADKFKEAWDNANFYEIGQAAGEKLKKALQDINWDKIQTVGEKAAKSLATGLNGFLEAPDLFKTVGSTVAESLNTVFGTANTFAEKFHWTSLGQAVSDSINSFFGTFNFKLAAKAISNWAKGLLDSAIAAVQGVEWKNVGKKAADFLANIDWGGLLKKGFTLAGSAAGAIASAVAGFFEDAISNVKNYFTDKINACGGDIVEGIWTGIKDAIAGTYNWIKTNIFQPFINGFMKVFGIASPSKEMKPLGENIIAGVLEGLKNKFNDIVTWFKELPGKIVEKVGEIAMNVKAKLTEWKDDLKDKLINFKANLNEKVDSIKSKVLDFKANLNEKVDSIKSKVLDFTANLKDKAVGFKEKALDFVANLTSHMKGSKFSNTISDMKASIIDKFKAKGFSNILDNIQARLTDKFKAKGFSNTLDNMKARLTDKFKGKGFDSTLGNMKASFKYREKASSFNSTLGNMKASFKYREKASDFNSTLGYMTASFRYRKKASDFNSTLTGMKAEISSYKWSAGSILVQGGLELQPQAGGGLFVNGKWKPITAAAEGGAFSMGQMFVAREAGPELVGRIGTKTAVMNNDQIVSSVANGVAKAVASVLGNNQTTVVLEGDAKTLFRAVKREATNYTNSTGLAAFPV